MNKIAALLITAFALVGCTGSNFQAAKLSTSGTGTATGVVGTGGTVNAQGLVDKCSNGTNAIGYIYDGGGSPTSFANRVIGFISGNLNPSDFGDISGVEGASTGIDFQLRLPLSNGQLNVGQTAMLMKIYDSFVGNLIGTKQVEAYEIPFGSASSGSVNLSARTFTLTFQDSIGSITVKGSWDSAYARGTVEFQNNTSVTGGTAASGLLGNFKVPSCGLF